MWEGVLFLKLTNKILFAEKSLKKFKKIQKNSKKLKTKKKISPKNSNQVILICI
jgi:hypothetical protein